MCPACAANAALMAAGAVSTGGLTALAVKKLVMRWATMAGLETAPLAGNHRGV